MTSPPLRALLVAGCALLAAACGSDSSPTAECPAACTQGCDTSGACLTGLSCAPVQASEAATAQRLGSHRVGETVSFQVPAGTASVTIIEQAVKAPQFISFGGSLANTAVPNKVRGPSGQVLYDDSAAVPTDPAAVEALTTFFASSSPAIGTLTLPNASGGLALAASGLPAGAWSLLVSDYAWECTGTRGCTGGATDSVYDVTVITRPLVGGAPAAAGTLDVVFWLVAEEADGLALSAAGAASDPDLQRLEASLRAILGSAEVGLTVGNVTYRDVAPSVQARYATGVDVDQSGACAPLGQLLRLAESGSVLNVFLVTNFTLDALPAGTVVAGIDGTIPGPATVPGSVASGVAVSVADLRSGSATAACTGPLAYDGVGGTCGADVTAYIVAHEAGHFLGLYHTVEAEGTRFDPLADTGRCPCATCAPSASQATCDAASSAYRMSRSDCDGAVAGCGGGDNLMFYLLDTGAQAKLTPEQRAVALSNPLLR